MSRFSRTINRRTLLRGLGVAIGLPWLETMRPANAFRSVTDAKRVEAPTRMACLFFPNGVSPNSWTPEGVGTAFEASPILESLSCFRDDVLILTNLTNRATDTGDGHYVKDAAWLTGTTIRRTTGADLNSGGASMDQVAAQRIGNLTPLPSLELGVEPITTGVDINVGYTRLYGSHISWANPTTPIAKEINPKLAFDRLFRSRAGKKAGRIDDDLSVLDAARDDASSLRGRLGQADRLKLDEYFESVRAIEKRIAFESSERHSRYLDDPTARAAIEKLGGRIDAYHTDPGRLRQRELDHTEPVRLMLDLIVLAFQTDSTRVASFMFGNSVSNKNFSFLPGVKGGHHELSHHENDPKKLEQYQRISAWHVAQFAYLLDRLRRIGEGEGTLLDHSMILFGSALRDGNSHNPHDLPIILAGRAGGTLATGRHLSYPKDTPLCRLYVSMLDRVGAPVDRFADGDGPLAGLDDPDFQAERARI